MYFNDMEHVNQQFHSSFKNCSSLVKFYFISLCWDNHPKINEISKNLNETKKSDLKLKFVLRYFNENEIIGTRGYIRRSSNDWSRNSITCIEIFYWNHLILITNNS